MSIVFDQYDPISGSIREYIFDIDDIVNHVLYDSDTNPITDTQLPRYAYNDIQDAIYSNHIVLKIDYIDIPIPLHTSIEDIVIMITSLLNKDMNSICDMDILIDGMSIYHMDTLPEDRDIITLHTSSGGILSSRVNRMYRYAVSNDMDWLSRILMHKRVPNDDDMYIIDRYLSFNSDTHVLNTIYRLLHDAFISSTFAEDLIDRLTPMYEDADGWNDLLDRIRDSTV